MEPKAPACQRRPTRQKPATAAITSDRASPRMRASGKAPMVETRMPGTANRQAIPNNRRAHRPKPECERTAPYLVSLNSTISLSHTSDHCSRSGNSLFAKCANLWAKSGRAKGIVGAVAQRARGSGTKAQVAARPEDFRLCRKEQSSLPFGIANETGSSGFPWTTGSTPPSPQEVL